MTRIFQALKGRIASNAALAAERYGPVIGGQVYNAVSAGVDNVVLPCSRLTSESEAVKLSLLLFTQGMSECKPQARIRTPQSDLRRLVCNAACV